MAIPGRKETSSQGEPSSGVRYRTCLRFRGVFLDVDNTEQLKRLKDLRAGTAELPVRVDCVYTLTTLPPAATAFRPAKRGAARRRFPATHTDDFEDTPPGRPGRLWADLSGSFEVAATPRGHVLRQSARRARRRGSTRAVTAPAFPAGGRRALLRGEGGLPARAA